MLRRLASEFADHLGLSDPTKPSVVAPDEEIVFFPSLARREGAGVRVRIHGWIFRPERDSLKRAALRAGLAMLLRLGDPSRFAPGARAIFNERLGPFLVDNERAKRIAVRLGGSTFVMPRSAANGQFSAEFAAPAGAAVGDELRYRAVLPDGDARVFEGVARIVPDAGRSVVTDIDDTLKVSGVHDAALLLRRTFTEPFEPVPGAANLLARLSAAPGSTVHYLSAAPWQLYGPLSRFLDEHGYPPGSMHLRAIRLKDRTLLRLFKDPSEHKLAVIRRLMQSWPQRRFVLVGDSGEKDPELYATIAAEHPGRVEHVYIRDVTGESMTAPRYRRSLWTVLEDRWTLFADAAGLPLPR